MQSSVCSTCGKSKASLTCGLCHASICKACAHFMDEGQFSFLQKIPVDLRHSTYCDSCFMGKVSAELDVYNQKMERAREVLVFEKSEAKETRQIKRDIPAVRVSDCPDYDEAILRLAFFAVELDCNAIIDVDLASKKTRVGNYQSSLWSGTGIPANVQPGQLVKDRSIRHNPN